MFKFSKHLAYYKLCNQLVTVAVYPIILFDYVVLAASGTYYNYSCNERKQLSSTGS